MRKNYDYNSYSLYVKELKAGEQYYLFEGQKEEPQKVTILNITAHYHPIYPVGTDILYEVDAKSPLKGIQVSHEGKTPFVRIEDYKGV